ncbi:MAG TPA: hypothetical protein VJT73_02805 [Polyangiaceae bacterium]|nr:hypothetical protein [Polyangiaceae bacterium]
MIPSAGRFVLLGIVLLGCTSAASPPRFQAAGGEEAAPPWATGGAEALYPRDRYVVGIGTCGSERPEAERLTCATDRAIGRAVAMVRQHVRVTVHRDSAVIRRASKDDTDTVVVSRDEHVGTGQAELVVDDVAPRQTACRRDVCHALVALDRLAMSRKIARRVAALSADLSRILDSAEQSEPVATVALLWRAARLAEAIDAESDLLVTIAGPSAGPAKAWDRLYAVRAKRMASLSVCMSSRVANPAPARIFVRARSDLLTRGFSRVAIAGSAPCEGDAMWIEFDGSSQERVVGATTELRMVEVHGTVTLSSVGRKLAGAEPVLGRGFARTREQAASEAEQDLAANVQEAVAKLFGASESNEP